MIRTLCCLILLSVAFPTSAAVTFDWATVGNLGNAADSTGYGSVGYAYRISKHEVTAGQYTEFLNAVAASDPNGLYSTNMWVNAYGCKIERLGSDGSYTYQVAADWANRPVNYVSFFDAMRFTNWLHNGQGAGGTVSGETESGVYNIGTGFSETRSPTAKYWIPSENEWYKAAYHKNDGVTGNYFDYPTSSDTAPGYVNNIGNLSGTGNPFVEGGTDPGGYATYDGDGGTHGIGAPYHMTEVGEWENSSSPYGTYDQGGNVWEWNETLYSGVTRGLRGSSSSESFFELRADQFLAIGPGNESNQTGFRLATFSVPEPSTAVMGILAAAGFFVRRRA